MIYMACIIQKTMYKMKRGWFYRRRYCSNNSEIKSFCQTTRKIWPYGAEFAEFSITRQVLENGEATEVCISGTERTIDF